MDIHPPHGPVHSVREFLLHLSIVTLGIVIALSLEGLLEWRHHRALVREARANVMREIRDNKTHLDNALARAGEVEQSQRAALQVVDDALAHRKNNTTSLTLSYGIVELHSSSWETAQATGAVGFMEYAEVKRFAELYSLQKRLDSVQDQLLNNFIVSLPPEDPAKASEPELREMKQGIQRTLAYLHAGESIAKGLSDQYAKVLASGSD